MPMAIGVASSSDTAAASSVPKISGPTKPSRLVSSGNQLTASDSSDGSAVRAGHARWIRNTATAARITRIRTPAPVATQRKARLPPRSPWPERSLRAVVPGFTGSVGPAVRGWVLVTRSPGGGGGERSCLVPTAGPPRGGPAGVRAGGAADGSRRPPLPRWSGRQGDRVDRGLDVGAQGVRDRRGARGRLGGRLALGGRDVGRERLDQVDVVLRVVGLADDQVRGEDQRVGAGLGRGAVDVDHDVTLLARVVARGDVEGGRGGLLRRGDELVADLDGDLAERAGLRGVRVADGALAALDGLDQAGGALAGLAALDRPVAGGLGRPGAVAGLRQVVGEVLRGARLVRAVQLGDALEVEDDGDRGDVDRQVHRVGAEAALLRLGQLVLVERGVGTRELHGAVEERGAATTRADRVVRDRDVGVRVLEPGAPGLHRGLLRRGARAGELTREGAGRGVGAAGGLGGARRVVRTTCREGEGDDAGEGEGTRTTAVELHSVVRPVVTRRAPVCARPGADARERR